MTAIFADRFDRTVIAILFALVLVIGVVTALGDHVAMTVASFQPADGASPAVTTDVRITFAEPVQQASAEAAFGIEPAVDGVISWDGDTLVFVPDVGFASGRSYTVTLAPGATSQSGRVMRRALSWAFTPRDSSVLYLSPADQAVRNLWRISTSGGEPEEVYAPEGGVYDFAASPDGTQIAVTVLSNDATTDIWLIDIDGGGRRRLTDCAPGSCSGPDWSPDGELIAYERRSESLTGTPGPSRIWLYDVTIDETAVVFEDSQVLGYTPQWSADGSRLAFFDANSQAIRILELATGDTILIPSHMGEVGSFSANGLQMVYVDIRPVGQQYYPQLWFSSLGPDDGVQQVFDDPKEDHSPSWSPDGRWIAFSRRLLDRSNGWANQLMLLDAESDELIQATNDPVMNNTAYVWSPASDRILVQRFDLEQTNATPQLWLYTLDSGDFTLLAENAFNGQWLP